MLNLFHAIINLFGCFCSYTDAVIDACRKCEERKTFYRQSWRYIFNSAARAASCCENKLPVIILKYWSSVSLQLLQDFKQIALEVWYDNKEN